MGKNVIALGTASVIAMLSIHIQYSLSVAKEVKVETDQSDHGKVMSSEYLIGQSRF